MYSYYVYPFVKSLFIDWGVEETNIVKTKVNISGVKPEPMALEQIDSIHEYVYESQRYYWNKRTWSDQLLPRDR